LNCIILSLAQFRLDFWHGHDEERGFETIIYNFGLYSIIHSVAQFRLDCWHGNDEERGFKTINLCPQINWFARPIDVSTTIMLKD
jgi:hypothetical protein